MNKWYKSHLMKILLVVLVCLSVTAMAVFGLVLTIGMKNNVTWRDITDNTSKQYVKSESFAQTITQSSYDITQQLFNTSLFETNGVYNPDKLVDIKQYNKDLTINGENNSGFAYKISELANWNREQSDDVQPTLYVVCKKPDKTYYYYTYDEFKEILLNGSLKFNISSDDTSISTASILNDLYTGANTGTAILNNENQMIYTDCWTLISSIAEIYPPDGADSILDIANNNPDWNGKLSEMLDALDFSIKNLEQCYSEYQSPYADYTEGNSNLSFVLVDSTKQKIYSNRSAYTDIKQSDQYLKELKKLGAYVIYSSDSKNYDSNLETPSSGWNFSHFYIGDDQDNSDYTFAIAVDTTFPIQDSFYTSAREYEFLMPYMIPLLIVEPVLFFIFLLAMVWLTLIIGRNTRGTLIPLNQFDKIWSEVAAAIVVGICALLDFGLIYIVEQISSNHYIVGLTATGITTFATLACIALITSGFFLIEWCSLIRRIKNRTLWSNSLLRKLCHLIIKLFHMTVQFSRDFWNHRKQSTQIVLATLLLMVLHAYVGFQGFYFGGLVFILILVDAAIAIYLIRKAVIRDRIKSGIREISEGNIAYRIDTTHMRGNDLETATLVNNVGNGLRTAVEQSMKDERMKTDLITNVSHDIKTPLTSIINYVDLLKRENFTDPKVVGYIEILEQKAQRLKTLTEDVVEASKASSGNITLEMMNINLAEILAQIEGEFIDKFKSRNLSVVTNHPAEPVIVYADGRRCFRILENLYGNAYKYAMEGTRIYADLRVENDRAEFSLKNVSQQPLNISADELTERFIRGDVSRTTEGSGLGLSIAKSLTQLQGGTFDLYLDGDLFKVTITFPIGKK